MCMQACLGRKMYYEYLFLGSELFLTLGEWETNSPIDDIAEGTLQNY